MNIHGNWFQRSTKRIVLLGNLAFSALEVLAGNKALLFPFTFGNTNVENAIVQKYESDPKVWEEEGLFLVAFCYARNGRSNEFEKVWGAISEPAVSNYIRKLKVKTEKPYRAYLLDMLATNGIDKILFPTASHSTLNAIMECYKANPGIWDVGQLDLAGSCYYIEGNVTDAIKAYEQKYELAPTDVDTMQALVTALIAAGEVGKAEKIASDVWRRNQAPLALEYLGIIKIMRHDHEGFAQLVDELLKHQGESEQIRTLLLGYAMEVNDIGVGKKILNGVKASVTQKELENNAELRRAIVKVSLFFDKLDELSKENGSDRLDGMK
ncbi:MAG: tetratricopeptide repeat protein [Kiritimatiellae bacterium]|nr:tetratricopeptide repeat protein [Kiritimatiellia bacterium]